MKTQSIRYSALALVLTLGISADAYASFSGDYAVSNWTITDNAGGSVDTSGAPDSLTLTSGNGGDPLADPPVSGDTSFTITAQTQSLVSFNWSYHTNDIYGFAAFDPFGYVVNGEVTVLPDQNLAPATPTVSDPTGTLQSGSATFYVNAGDVFGFDAQTYDGLNGAAVGSVTNFTVTAVPLPAAFWLFSSALVGVVSIARRRKSA